MKPYYKERGITIYHGDCREIMPQLGKFDLLLTDPPYGIDAPNMTLGAGRKDFLRGDWDFEAPDLSQIIPLAEYACIWGGNYFPLPLTNHWLIWHKLNDGRSFSECEMAWTNFGLQTRCLQHHWSGEIKQHPTQKPQQVLRWCITLSPLAKSVLDPFLGSGTTLVAAKAMGLTGVGIEQEEKYCEIAANRLRQEVFDFSSTA